MAGSGLEMENGFILGCVVFMLTTQCSELISMIVLQRRILPLLLRFKEHGKGISAETMSVSIISFILGKLGDHSPNVHAICN